jgi:NAD(P)-dependent dehydrogenase (short-subunit alcohol dehydrogenase family)
MKPHLAAERVVITGGSRGLGLGVAEAFVARGAHVTVVARDAGALAEAKARLGVEAIAADASDAAVARDVLADRRPSVLVLNAGTTPTLGPIDELGWDDFSAAWNADVKIGLAWLQAALRLPLGRGARVLVGSSGAAIGGSPLSGGYAGAKRMLWLLAGYARDLAAERDLGISFQTLVPMQVVGATRLGRAVAEAYAARRGVAPADFLAGFGPPLTPARYGELVVEIVDDPRHATTPALALRASDGVTALGP